jgi:hypothetical protein
MEIKVSASLREQRLGCFPALQMIFGNRQIFMSLAKWILAKIQNAFQWSKWTYRNSPIDMFTRI